MERCRVACVLVERQLGRLLRSDCSQFRLASDEQSRVYLVVVVAAEGTNGKANSKCALHTWPTGTVKRDW